MKAAVQTKAGSWLVDLENDEVLESDVDVPESQSVALSLPLVVAAAASGSTVVAVIDRRPPLAISHDAGETWREAGGGLPAGFAVAIADDEPDRMLYAARNRLYVSANGGVFWRGLTLELPDIVSVAWID